MFNLKTYNLRINDHIGSTRKLGCVRKLLEKEKYYDLFGW